MYDGRKREEIDMERIFILAMCIYSAYMVYSVIFRWKNLRERAVNSGRGLFGWLEKMCGETITRIILGILFSAIIICFGMAFISGEI